MDQHSHGEEDSSLASSYAKTQVFKTRLQNRLKALVSNAQRITKSFIKPHCMEVHVRLALIISWYLFF